MVAYDTVDSGKCFNGECDQHPFMNPRQFDIDVNNNPNQHSTT